MVNTYSDYRYPDTHENQGGIEILVVFLHVFGIIFHRLSFVHGVEIELRVVVLDGTLVRRGEEESKFLMRDVCQGLHGHLQTSPQPSAQCSLEDGHPGPQFSVALFK